MKPKNLISVLAIQAQATMDMSAMKVLLLSLAPVAAAALGGTAAQQQNHAEGMKGLVTWAAALPYALAHPVAGWCADRFAKSTVLRLSLVAQIGAVAALLAACLAHSFWWALGGVFLFNLNATFLSNARYGVLKEYVGSERLGMAVGLMEAVFLLAFLVGSSGGVVFDHATRWSGGDAWSGAVWTTLLLLALALGALAGPGTQLEPTQPQTRERFRLPLLWSHFGCLAWLFGQKRMWRAAVGNAFFFFLGAALPLALTDVAQRLAGGDLIRSASRLTELMLSMGVGIMVGAVLVARISRRRNELGVSALGGIGMTLGLVILAVLPPEGWAFKAALALAGGAGAWFALPLSAFVQDEATDERRGTALAATGLLVNLGVLVAATLYWLLASPLQRLAGWLHTPFNLFFLVLALIAGGVAGTGVFLLREPLVRLVGRGLVNLNYRLRTRGYDQVPRTGGVLLLPNHVTWIDAVLLQAACPRPIRFLVYEPIYRQKWLNPIFRLFRAIPVKPRPRAALQEAVALLRAGEVVCIYPEGELSRTGTLLRLRKGFEWIAREAGAPVVPVWIDQLWGSIFSFEGGRYFNKLPRRWPYPVTVAFGAPLAAGEADVATARERLLALSAATFEDRPLMRRHLGEACLRGLRHRPGEVALIDGLDGSQMTRGRLLAAACALAGHLRRTTPGQQRIGVVLPPGRGAVLANLAVVLAGKVPVNFNFTAGRASLESAVRRSGVATALTARLAQKKLDGFPWPAQTWFLEELMPGLRRRAVLWRALVQVAPWWLLTRLVGVPRRGGHREAVLLFTSGSGGEPKGVVLSHRNILANVTQFRTMANLREGEPVLASLPFFHSFGCTVTLWFPLIEGLRQVTHPNPLDVARNAELVARHRVALFFATPTFLRAYLRKATPEQFASVKLCVVGAEKLPESTARAFAERFGRPALEGYGLTEAAPVVSANLPDNVHAGEVQPAHRPGSVGKLAPGLAAQIRDPETGRARSLHESGMLWLKGPNIFEGYLEEPEATAQAFDADGWFRTGDLARFDEDGFLTIEGRLSRFSKVGGEMVPHESVEARLQTALGLAAEAERTLVVVGVPDEAKGEVLVVLSTTELDLPALRGRLLEAGVPSLWIPKVVRRVEALPVLGTGKLDLRRCRELAQEEVGAVAGVAA